MAKAPKKPSRKVTWSTVRALALALPGVEESTSYRTPAMKVRGKLIARLKEDGETIVVPMTIDERDVRIEGPSRLPFVAACGAAAVIAWWNALSGLLVASVRAV